MASPTSLGARALRRVVVVVLTAAMLVAAVARGTDVSAFTATQQQHTRTFLLSFVDPLLPNLRSNWTGTNFCSWIGLVCTPGGTVGMHLASFYVTAPGSLPEVPSDVDPTQVTVTDIRVEWFDNMLAGTLPETWSVLTSLTRLSLTSDALAGTLPASWSRLTSLNYLNLGSNSLVGELPPSWNSMSSLANLYLELNSLTGRIPKTWGDWPSLRSVFLFGNLLTGCVPASWAANGVQYSVDAALMPGQCTTSSSDDSSSSSSNPPLPSTSSSSSSSSTPPLPSTSSSSSSSSSTPPLPSTSSSSSSTPPLPSTSSSSSSTPPLPSTSSSSSSSSSSSNSSSQSTPAPIRPSSSSSHDDLHFATFLKKMCPSADSIASSQLETYKDFVCCSDMVTSATVCGDMILMMRGGRVYCRAPPIVANFTCCASVDAQGTTEYIGTSCGTSRDGNSSTASASTLLSAAVMAAVALVAAVGL
ncbi:hypothetical protein NESM_000533000 [Novymonas esmeraldas]|uniref:GP46-like surface antigen n=1 Tax=Novymonas esmeraldas TaxID=1808958 RepID=A0AAW0ER85_9TRYP